MYDLSISNGSNPKSLLPDPDLEVNAAVAVLVEYPEDLVDEDGRVAGGQDHGVHVEDLRLVQDSVRAVGLRFATGFVLLRQIVYDVL